MVRIPLGMWPREVVSRLRVGRELKPKGSCSWGAVHHKKDGTSGDRQQEGPAPEVHRTKASKVVKMTESNLFCHR